MRTFFIVALFGIGSFVSAADISAGLKGSVETDVNLPTIRYQGEVEAEGAVQAPAVARPTVIPTFEDVPYETPKNEPQKTPQPLKKEPESKKNPGEINWAASDLTALRVRLSTGSVLNDVVVRGWDPKKKEEIIANGRSITTREQLAVYAEALALDDMDITALAVTDAKITMSHNETGKFLGFIPVRYTLTATADLTSGTIATVRDWKARFLSKNDAKARLDAATLATLTTRSGTQTQAHALATLSATMKAKHDVSMNSIRNMK